MPKLRTGRALLSPRACVCVLPLQVRRPLILRSLHKSSSFFPDLRGPARFLTEFRLRGMIHLAIAANEGKL
jgi:hypothetical protein